MSTEDTAGRRLVGRVARFLQIAIDLAALAFVFRLAFLLRFEFVLLPRAAEVFSVTLPYVVGLQYAGLACFGVPRAIWRYVGLREAIRVCLGLLIPTVLLVGLRLLAPRVDVFSDFAIPLSVLAMDYALACLAIMGVRAARRLVSEADQRHRRKFGKNARPTLLIGAGQAGLSVAREIRSRPDLGIKPVGFVDDDSHKHGNRVHGVPVLGAIRDLPEIACRLRVKHALITIANAGGQDIRRITDACQEAGLETRIIPGIYEIVGGQVNLSRIREVAIEDLLGRAPVELEEDLISAVLKDRVVMVTGAGGSIGAELCRQVCRFHPSRLVLVERCENNLFEIHRELSRDCPDIAIMPFLADICDECRMRSAFDAQEVEFVFHAAAYKHVPMMEWNPREAIKNNIFGTQLVARLADEFSVEGFVLISTDKAVNPASVMGATKRVAEMYIQMIAQGSRTRFVAVRFGNVLGSAGSVIPIFREQIAHGGPIKVTDARMMRYFMTIAEASQLVLQASAMGEGGEIFILDMGAPVKIVDLAHDLIRLSGLVPNEDIKVEFTGLRPGEKLFEELMIDAENADLTRHPKIFVGLGPRLDHSSFQDGLACLIGRLDHSSGEVLKETLIALIAEFECLNERNHNSGLGKAPLLHARGKSL